MSMRVNCIRHVRVRMRDRFVPMPMAVCAVWFRIMRMRVMVIVVAMGMFMRHGLVFVRVFVRLCEMQDHAGQHESRAAEHNPTEGPVTERHGHCSTYERRKCED